MEIKQWKINPDGLGHASLQRGQLNTEKAKHSNIIFAEYDKRK